MKKRVITILPIRGSKTPQLIIAKFCVPPDVVTHANFGDDQFGRLYGEGRISGFPIDLHSRPYNTLA